MALMKCPECGKEVSDRASVCINCGFPIKEYILESKEKTQDIQTEELSKSGTEQMADKYKSIIQYYENVKCPVCGGTKFDGYGYCEDCGHQVLFRCPKCGTYNVNGAYQCINCKKDFDIIKNDPTVSQAEKTDISQKKEKEKGDYSLLWVFITVICCILIPPLGIVMMWIINKPKNLLVKIILTVILIAYSSSLYSGETGTSKNEVIEEAETDTNETELSRGPVSVKDTEDTGIEKSESDITEISQEDDLKGKLLDYIDESMANKLIDILQNQIGFADIRFVEKLGTTFNYKISADGYDIMVTDTGDDFRIFVPSSDIVFYENGDVITTMEVMNMKKIDSGDMINYSIMAKSIIENCLTNPLSADFCSHSEMVYNRFGDVVSVQGYVDAQNAFGAEVRSEWLVQFVVLEMDTYTCEPIYINIDGKTTGEYIEFE